jgi:hypothetical protein
VLGDVGAGAQKVHARRGGALDAAADERHVQVADRLDRRVQAGRRQLVRVDPVQGGKQRWDHRPHALPAVEPDRRRGLELAPRERQQPLGEQADRVLEVAVGHERERAAAVVAHELAGTDRRLATVLDDERPAAPGQRNLEVLLVGGPD